MQYYWCRVFFIKKLYRCIFDLYIYIFRIYKNSFQVTNTTAATQQWRETLCHTFICVVILTLIAACAGTACRLTVTTAANIEVLVGVQLGDRDCRTVVMVVVTMVSTGSHPLTVGPSSAAIAYTCSLGNILLNLWL